MDKQSLLVRQRFNRRASRKDETRFDAVSLHAAQLLLERLSCLAAPPQRILELGTGDSLLFKQVAQTYRQADQMLVDIADRLLQRAWSQRPWFRRTDAVAADAAALPFPDATFDLIYSNLMLQWVSEPEVVLRECLRVAKPETPLFLTAMGPRTLAELKSAWQATGLPLETMPGIDPEYLASALGRIGYHEIVVDIVEVHLDYQDLNGLRQDLRAAAAYNVSLKRCPHVITRKAWQQVMRAYPASTSQDTPYTALCEIVTATAWTSATPSIASVPSHREVRISLADIHPLRR